MFAWERERGNSACVSHWCEGTCLPVERDVAVYVLLRYNLFHKLTQALHYHAHSFSESLKTSLGRSMQC